MLDTTALLLGDLGALLSNGYFRLCLSHELSARTIQWSSWRLMSLKWIYYRLELTMFAQTECHSTVVASTVTILQRSKRIVGNNLSIEWFAFQKHAIDGVRSECDDIHWTPIGHQLEMLFEITQWRSQWRLRSSRCDLPWLVRVIACCLHDLATALAAFNCQRVLFILLSSVYVFIEA